MQTEPLDLDALAKRRQEARAQWGRSGYGDQTRDIRALCDDGDAMDAELRRLRGVETVAKHWLAEEPDPTGWILLTSKHLEAMRRAVEAPDGN
jgi:hypothetical protein